jgi:hypothetical protein
MGFQLEKMALRDRREMRVQEISCHNRVIRIEMYDTVILVVSHTLAPVHGAIDRDPGPGIGWLPKTVRISGALAQHTWVLSHQY